MQGDQEELRLDLKGLDDEQFKVPLDLIKKDGKRAIDLLSKNYKILLKKYASQQKTNKN